MPPPPSVMTTTERDAQVLQQMQQIRDRFHHPPKDSHEMYKLLEEAREWLSCVKQSPSRSNSMDTVIHDIKIQLITPSLLKDSDSDVNLALTSCFVELARISAPDSPYDDESQMKCLFERFLKCLRGLDDEMDSKAYKTADSILETLSKVGCLVMLWDLDLVNKITDLFDHFFKSICQCHPNKNTAKNMECVMVPVIKEGDNVSKELGQVILNNLSKQTEESKPASFALAKVVTECCKDKLRLVFLELLEKKDETEYSDIVTSMSQAYLDASKKDTETVSSTKSGKTKGKGDLKKKHLRQAKEVTTASKKKRS